MGPKLFGLFQEKEALQLTVLVECQMSCKVSSGDAVGKLQLQRIVERTRGAHLINQCTLNSSFIVPGFSRSPRGLLRARQFHAKSINCRVPALG